MREIRETDLERFLGSLNQKLFVFMNLFKLFILFLWELS